MANLRLRNTAGACDPDRESRAGRYAKDEKRRRATRSGRTAAVKPCDATPNRARGDEAQRDPKPQSSYNDPPVRRSDETSRSGHDRRPVVASRTVASTSARTARGPAAGGRTAASPSEPRRWPPAPRRSAAKLMRGVNRWGETGAREHRDFVSVEAADNRANREVRDSSQTQEHAA